MNKLNYLLLSALVIGFIGLAGCGDDSGPGVDPVASVTERLSKTWVVEGNSGKVLYGNTSADRTMDYSSFSITFTDGEYTTTEVDVPDPWPGSGTWSFENEENITDPNQEVFSIKRGDELIINVQLDSEAETLTLNLVNYDPNDGGHDDDVTNGSRVAAVEGNWVFNLVAQ